MKNNSKVVKDSKLKIKKEVIKINEGQSITALPFQNNN